MRIRRRSLATVGLAALACALLFVRCEESDVFAPSDGTMQLDAIPGTVVIDTEATDPSADVTIRAQLFSAGGFPLSDRTILFSATGGVLASGGQGVETDDNGIATDTLTVTEGDPESIEVTARSGTVSGTVTVTKSELTGEIVVTADDTTFDLDPDNGPATGTTRVEAQVLDTQGDPVAGVPVQFSTDGGTLGVTTPVTTNAGGVAQNSLTVGVSDAPGVTVTARSGGLVGELDITIALPGQTPPTAVLTATPPSGQAQVGEEIVFSGSSSTDPEDDISCYRFTFSAQAVAASPELTTTTITQTQPSLAPITFDTPITTLVTLLVTDDTGASFPCNNTTDFDSQDDATLTYVVTACTPPNADAAVQTNTDTTVPFDVVLTGSGSTAPGSTIEEYEWTCNNEANDIETGVTATCSYTTPGQKTVSLKVTNSAVCGSQTDTDTVQFTVGP
jgi:hypothetical protein